MASRSNMSRQSGRFSFDGVADQSRRRDSETSDVFTFEAEGDRSRRRDSEKSDFYSFADEAQTPRSPDQSFYSMSSRRTLLPTTPGTPGSPRSPGSAGLPTPVPRQHSFAEVQEPPAQIRMQVPNNPAAKRKTVFFSVNVTPLSDKNFDEFVAPLEKALVYFHDSSTPANPELEYKFSTAADTTRHQGYGFATIDCGYEQSLCALYDILRTPALKLFSNGFEVSTIKKPQGFSADAMKQLMVMTPVLNKPLMEVGQDYKEQAIDRRAAAQAQMTPVGTGKFCW